MTDRKPFAHDPPGVPRSVADGVRIVDGPVVKMAMGPLNVPFPIRMTVLQLPDGIRVHSPISLTDLIENVAPARVGTVWRWIMAAAGNPGPTGSTPRDDRAVIPDKLAVGSVAQQMIAPDPARVILAHGDCHLENPVPRLQQALGRALRKAA